MLSVQLAYKTLEDLTEEENNREVPFDPSEIIGALAENMLFITQDFSDGVNVSGFGRELLSDYFSRVPMCMRADVFIAYLDMLADDGFDIDVIREQAKL